MPADQIERPPEAAAPHIAVALAERALASATAPADTHSLEPGCLEPPPAESEALIAARRAMAGWEYNPQTLGDHSAQLAELRLMELSVVSPALRRAIKTAADEKIAYFEAWQAHSRAEQFKAILQRHGGAREHELEAASAAEEEAMDAYTAAREKAADAFFAVSKAPFGSVYDLRVRAEAVCLLDGFAADGTPSDDGDAFVALASLRAGLEEIDAVRPKDPDGQLASARRAYWQGELALWRASKADEESQKREGLRARSQMEAASEAVLKAPACTLPELQFKLEELGRRVGIDVGSYAARDGVLKLEPGSGADPLHCLVASIAADVAAFVEAELPADWRAMMQTLGRSHPNGRDAVMTAYAASFDLADLMSVQLAGAPEENLPRLHFNQGDGRIAWAEPAATWEGRPVA